MPAAAPQTEPVSAGAMQKQYHVALCGETGMSSGTSDNFALSGSYTSQPTPGLGSGFPAVECPIDEELVLIGKQLNTLDLESDGSVSIPFTNISQAQVLMVKPTGGWCDVIITTTEGSAQKIPVGRFLALLFDDGVPLTALSISRQPATPVQVQIFLGQTT